MDKFKQLKSVVSRIASILKKVVNLLLCFNNTQITKTFTKYLQRQPQFTGTDVETEKQVCCITSPFTEKKTHREQIIKI